MHGIANFGRARIVVGLLVACGACTLIVDRNSTQCASDTDCERFGSHPFCSNGVCVPSGLGPPACFFGTPQQAQDFLNQCSSAQCQAFDDCQRLSICDGGSPALIPPPDAGTAVATSPPDAAKAVATPAVSDAAMTSDAALMAADPPVPSDAAPASDASESDAKSLPSCVDAAAGRSPVLYMTGSSYFPPLLAKLAPLIISKSGYIPVYQVTNSCGGVKSVLGTHASDHTMSDPPPGSTAASAAYFNADGTSVPCSLGPIGAPVDVGESDIFSTSCTGFGAPGAGIGEYLGPVQSMVFVVPGTSKQMTISAAAAREVFGMGGNHDAAAPWTDPTLYFVRNANAGTQQIIAHAINVPASAFWGIDRGSPTNIDKDMRVIENPTEANQAIGILASDTFDQDRSNLHALAFKATEQDCAYLPDSTEFKMDKQNVRDGHYPIWGPLHFFTDVSAGVPVSPGAQAFVSAVVVPNLAQQLVDAFIASSLVPDCAMNVQRTTELGPLSPYSPTFQCTCHFESQASGAPPPGCTQCRTSNDCNDPTHPACNLGFCEVR